MSSTVKISVSALFIIVGLYIHLVLEWKIVAAVSYVVGSSFRMSLPKRKQTKLEVGLYLFAFAIFAALYFTRTVDGMSAFIVATVIVVIGFVWDLRATAALGRRSGNFKL